MRLVGIAFLGVMGCGARTGLDEGSLDAGPRDVVPVATGPRVLFDLFDDEGYARLYVIGADGLGGRDVPVPGGRAMYPTFTRDGRYLLYVQWGARDGDAAQIVALDLRTRSPRTIVRAPNLSALAASPDGRSVAYAAGLDLRAIGWDGAGDRLLVRGPYEIGCCQWGYGHPAFAADPRTVFYATAGRVERIGLDGARRQHLLTEDFRRIIFPNVAVSPDGTRLAVPVFCQGGSALRTYAIASLPAGCEAGDVVTAIERSDVGNQANNPAWGESGQIVFQQGDGLLLVDERGGAARDLTRALVGGADDRRMAAYPTWVPAGVSLP